MPETRIRTEYNASAVLTYRSDGIPVIMGIDCGLAPPMRQLTWDGYYDDLVSNQVYKIMAFGSGQEPIRPWVPQMSVSASEQSHSAVVAQVKAELLGGGPLSWPEEGYIAVPHSLWLRERQWTKAYKVIIAIMGTIIAIGVWFV